MNRGRRILHRQAFSTGKSIDTAAVASGRYQGAVKLEYVDFGEIYRRHEFRRQMGHHFRVPNKRSATGHATNSAKDLSKMQNVRLTDKGTMGRYPLVRSWHLRGNHLQPFSFIQAGNWPRSNLQEV